MIAERAVDLLMPTGERIAFRVEFGPIRETGQSFRCQVRYHGGWEDSPPDIGGYDSLQAFLLAIDLVHTMLLDCVRRGIRVVWPGSSRDYDLDAFLVSGSKAELGAAPNCGPAASVASSGTMKGPQSVT
jgi:hypothetical protein